MTPPAKLLEAYTARNPQYVLLQPQDMPKEDWRFITEAIDFATRTCEQVLSMPAGPPN